MITRTTFAAGLARFLQWWLAGLRAALPERLRRAWGLQRYAIAISVDDEAVYLVDGTVEDEQAMRRFDPRVTQERAALQAALRERDAQTTELVLLLPETEVLRKRLVWPAAAARDAQRILALELDKETPFAPEQACYDHHVVALDRETGALTLELFVAPKDSVERIVERAVQATGRTLARATVVEDGAPLTAIDLLPQRTQPDLPPQRLARGVLTGLAIVLALAVLYLPLVKQERIISALEHRVEAVRGRASEARALMQRKRALEEHVQFLAERRRTRPRVIEVLEELTVRLPDDTWVTRLTIDAQRTEIAGESKSASALIALLDGSQRFREVRFHAPVTRNAASGKERFALTAKTQPPDPP